MCCICELVWEREGEEVCEGGHVRVHAGGLCEKTRLYVKESLCVLLVCGSV